MTAERIVGDDELRAQADRTVIPGFAVDAVVEAPYGSFPHECFGLYEADFSHFDEYVAQARDAAECAPILSATSTAWPTTGST